MNSLGQTHASILTKLLGILSHTPVLHQKKCITKTDLKQEENVQLRKMSCIHFTSQKRKVEK